MGSHYAKKEESKNVNSQGKIEDKNIKKNKTEKKQKTIKFEAHLFEIKSKYIIQLIFDNLCKGKALSIIQYNKKLKDKLDITINDYKINSEEFSNIIIEITPAKNIYGKFININKKYEQYYHIYFDNNKEEIKRYYLKDKENVNKILVKINHQVTSLSQLFEECSCFSSINFKVFNRKNITDISYMFKWCHLLKYLNISNFITTNVTNMRCLFDGCSLLNEIDVSHFSTKNVTDMSAMFYNCSSLKDVNLSNFDTINVINLSWMFAGCSSLKKINLSNFYTPKVLSMNEMFFNCSQLEEVNISNFTFQKKIYMKHMFAGCNALKQEKILSKVDLNELNKSDGLFN